MAESSWVGWMFPQQKAAQQQAHQREKMLQPEKPEASREDEDSLRHDFRVGDRVEYYSTGYQEWIDAKILGVHSDGQLLDLDVKKDIPVQRVRFPTHQPSAVHAGADNRSSHLSRYLAPEVSKQGMPATEHRSWTAEVPSGAGNANDQSTMQDRIMDKVNNIIKVQLLQQDRRVTGMFNEERRRYEKLIKDMKEQLSEVVDSAQMNSGVQLVSDAMRRDLSAQRLALTRLGEQVTLLSQKVSSVSVVGSPTELDQDSTPSAPSHELEDLRAQLADLRRTTQLAAVETGFLALAAADCTAPEKARLFNTLKMKEEAITGSDGRLKNILNAPLNKDEGAIEFQVRLTRIAAQKLGIAIEAQEDGILRVLSVEDDGVVISWNKNNPMRAVQAGDHITKVNDAVGNASRLQEELGRAMFSVLTIHRPCAAEQKSRPLSKR